jgi:hypothetical protein
MRRRWHRQFLDEIPWNTIVIVDSSEQYQIAVEMDISGQLL